MKHLRLEAGKATRLCPYEFVYFNKEVSITLTKFNLKLRTYFHSTVVHAYVCTKCVTHLISIKFSVFLLAAEFVEVRGLHS